jgi:hypothetical protein
MYKERASQMGKIMTNPRSKSEVISKTAKSRIEEAFLESSFGIKKEFWSKATTKGIEVEDDSIQLAGRKLGLFNLQKNEESFENDYFTGTPDVITSDLIIDVKSSFSGSTFPWFNEPDDIPTKDYFFQLQCYMALTGIKHSALIYCLVDAPEDMIEDEIRRQAWQHKMIDTTPEFEEKVRNQMTFEHIPEFMRCKVFEIPFDPDVISQMEERVLICRDYYESLSKKLKDNESMFNLNLESCKS